MERQIILIAHNLRSTHNVGSLLRTADGLGVSRVVLTGYSPYPQAPDDSRLPHLANKISAQISKTALGAETSVVWEHADDVMSVIEQLRGQGFRVTALEQAATAQMLPAYQPAENVALLVGREVEGIEEDVLTACDDIVEIPMYGAKESLNVSVAAAIALYHFRYA